MHLSFTEFELQKVFEKLNGNRTSNNENINKVHDLPGHASYLWDRPGFGNRPSFGTHPCSETSLA